MAHLPEHMNALSEEDDQDRHHSFRSLHYGGSSTMRLNVIEKGQKDDPNTPSVYKITVPGEGTDNEAKAETSTVKLFSFNDINSNDKSALTGNRTNPKTIDQKARDGKVAMNWKDSESGRSRGSKKFKLNKHDKEEMEFLQKGITTTTKRSTSTNKYNIDYDNYLEDEYEILQKVQ